MPPRRGATNTQSQRRIGRAANRVVTRASVAPDQETPRVAVAETVPEPSVAPTAQATQAIQVFAPMNRLNQVTAI